MIRVDSNTSSEDIRRSLNEFGFFSKIEVKREDAKKESTFFIREVGLLERLGKLFETKSKIKKRELESKAALIEMTLTHPKIAAMLGNSAISKPDWTAREFRRGVDLKQMSLRRIVEKKDPLPEHKNLLVTDATLYELNDFPQVNISYVNQVKNNEKNFRVTPRDAGVHVLTQWIVAQKDLKPLYSEIMESSKDVLVMGLVPDRAISDGVPDKFSDQNIDAFLGALDELEEKQKNQPQKRKIILSTEGSTRLYHRIIDRKLAYDAVKKANRTDGELNANDLLKLPANRQSAENQDAAYDDPTMILSVEGELEPTQWDGVHLLNTESPAYVAADQSIISLSSLANTKRPDGAADPIAALARGVQDSTDQFAWEKYHDKSVLQTIALPVDGLPVPELIGFVENLGDEVNRYQEIPAEKYQDFYKNFLKNSKGTVVIECPATSQAYVGLKMALEELEHENSLPKKVVLVASGASFSMARSKLGKSDSSSGKV